MINGAGSRQALQQGTPALHRLAAGQLQGGQEGLLETLLGIRLIAEDLAGRLPHDGPMLADNFLPVEHKVLQRLRRIYLLSRRRRPLSYREVPRHQPLVFRYLAQDMHPCAR
jgi:hypothetical protein